MANDNKKKSPPKTKNWSINRPPAVVKRPTKPTPPAPQKKPKGK